MRCFTTALVLLAALAAAPPSTGAPAAATAPDLSLGCTSYADESQALAAAPPGSRRVSPHVLLVKYRTGSRQFVDPKPYRQELSGRAWHYCGYIPLLKAHLVGEEDNDLFTGKLLNDSGRLLDAGHTIYPSPDGKLFLAARHSNGDELEYWVVSDLAGKVLWRGSSGVAKGASLLVEYDGPRWIADRVLEVGAECNDRSKARGEATLTLTDRSPRWQSSLSCTG